MRRYDDVALTYNSSRGCRRAGAVVACVEYAESQGMLVVERIRDTASGFTLDRPGMEQIRQLLRHGAVDMVLSYVVDRLSKVITSSGDA